MAEKRMFAKKVVDGDDFCSMPPTTQCLYFHLCMSADDDGFSNNIRRSMFDAHASVDDFNTLVSKKFVIPFESGVIVITHWKIHNYIQNDRYHETDFLKEKSMLVLQENGIYSNDVDTKCIQDVSKVYPENRLDKNSIDKNSKNNIVANAPKKFKKPTPDEVDAYCKERKNGISGQAFYDFYESKGWMIGKNPMKSWQAAVRTWEQKRNQSNQNQNKKFCASNNEDDLSDLFD